RELCAELLHGIHLGRDRLGLRRLPPPDCAVRSNPSGSTGKPREEPSHRPDATVGAASCPVSVTFGPERHRQSGPTKTVGRRHRDVTVYEILLLLDPEQAEAHQEELVARLRSLVEGAGGTWRSHDSWGRRRLAYEIRKKSEGVYHLVVFESSPETLDEVVRVLKIDDVVLRQMA